jgi:gliding motility-associated-like protein
VVGNIKATGSLHFNNRFNGKSDTLLVDKNTSSIASGVTDTVEFTVRVTTTEQGPFKNTAFAFGTDTTGAFKTVDASTTGFNPDPDGDGKPVEDTATVFVLTKPKPKVVIPNGFSPNGDGLNDLFYIDNPKGYHLRLAVYNRWGNIVYEKDNYDNSWAGVAEKGIFVGDKLPDGTYFYSIEYTDENGENQSQNGFLTLNR